MQAHGGLLYSYIDIAFLFATLIPPLCMTLLQLTCPLDYDHPLEVCLEHYQCFSVQCQMP